MDRSLLIIFFFSAFAAAGQGVMRQSYHDPEKKNLKELYQVRDTVRNVLHGRYISYYLNGNIESKGQFANNETTGVWEFYYETGNLKMRGILRQNNNFGLWEYFYESGQKSMEGVINGKNREGEWKMYYENGQVKEIGDYVNNKREGIWKIYFEDGVLKGEADYKDDHAVYTEFYHSGKVLSEGPRMGNKNTGHWRYFAEDGSLQSEGDFEGGKKTGEWKTYYPDGSVSSKGKYSSDHPEGDWLFYHPDGSVSAEGSYSGGAKTGTWTTRTKDGKTSSSVVYQDGWGQSREYYPSGKLKATGKIRHDKKEGKWEYYYEDGKRLGECDYQNGKGTYYGYFPNGNLQTKGAMDGDMRIGTWELYENDGKLSGYYKPFYDDKNLGKDIVALAGKTTPKPRELKKRSYFDARFNEFRGVIVAGNPVMVFAGRLPVSMEFYLQERLGHEFEFTGIRDPFFRLDTDIPAGQKFDRGYMIAIKQKFYNQIKAGMWYFGHEVRFTNYGHFINQPVLGGMDLLTFSAVEQRIQYGVLAGYRLMRRNNAEGFTIDAFGSFDLGYRGFDVDPNFAELFKDVKQSRVVATFHFGLNFGHVFSFR